MYQGTSGPIQSVQLLSRVWLFATPWTVAHQASLFITNSWSLLKLMPIESVMPSKYLILCHSLLLPHSIFPSIRLFSNESVLCIRWQGIGVSASASVLPMNIQDWYPLGWTSWISLQSKGRSRVFSNTAVQKHQFFDSPLVFIVPFSSVQFSHSIASDSLRPCESQHARPPCPSPTPRVHSNSWPSSRWCHPAISSSVVPFSSCPQSLPASVFSNESTLRWSPINVRTFAAL